MLKSTRVREARAELARSRRCRCLCLHCAKMHTVCKSFLTFSTTNYRCLIPEKKEVGHALVAKISIAGYATLQQQRRRYCLVSQGRVGKPALRACVTGMPTPRARRRSAAWRGMQHSQVSAAAAGTRLPANERASLASPQKLHCQLNVLYRRRLLILSGRRAGCPGRNGGAS